MQETHLLSKHLATSTQETGQCHAQQETREPRKHQCHRTLPLQAGEHTRLTALHVEMLIPATDSTASNPPLGEAPPGLPREPPSLLMAVKASKEISSIFQNTFTSVKFFPQQEKTTSWGVFQHLERRESTPYIFMLIDIFCFRNVNLFKRSLLF